MSARAVKRKKARKVVAKARSRVKLAKRPIRRRVRAYREPEVLGGRGHNISRSLGRTLD